MNFVSSSNEWNILDISILINVLCIKTIVLIFDRKREVMDISAIDETIFQISSNGNVDL